MQLIDRLKAATGPDRELDCLIFCETAQSPFTSYYPDCVLASLGGFAARLEISDIDHYTASIDAALALVERMLPVHRFALYTNGGGNGPCCLVAIGDEPIVANVHAPTLPLAILTALFTALQGKDKP